MPILNDNKKRFIRDTLIKSACNYKRLIETDYLIVTEDGQNHVVTFKVKDFNHLSGVNSDLSDSSFFYNCLKRTITINNIKTNQHYNYQTIKDKLKRLVEINNIIYADSSTNLVLLG